MQVIQDLKTLPDIDLRPTLGNDAVHIGMLKVCPVDQIGLAVHTARSGAEGQQTLILKQVERLLYMPEDSTALEKELQVLEK